MFVSDAATGSPVHHRHAEPCREVLDGGSTAADVCQQWFLRGAFLDAAVQREFTSVARTDDAAVDDLGHGATLVRTDCRHALENPRCGLSDNSVTDDHPRADRHCRRLHERVG
jgi:hypothetical protein